MTLNRERRIRRAALIGIALCLLLLLLIVIDRAT